MKRREFIRVLGGAAIAWSYGVEAQNKVSRIGFLRVGPPPKRFIEGLRQGLHELGYVEGQNLVIEYGLAQNRAQLPDVAARLVRLNVNVLVTSGSSSVLPAKNATSTIPVVFVGAFDPVAAGVVKSLARPGGNVTGLTHMHADLTGRRLQLLKEMLPKLTDIAVLARPSNPNNAVYVKEAEAATSVLTVRLKVANVRDTGELEDAFKVAKGSGALLVVADEQFTALRTRIAELALKYRLPTIFGFRDMVEAGGLMAYGPDYTDLWRRAASHVHKILQGANPADLPIEQPTKFEFVINLKTATALGLAIPPLLLARADEVIE